MTFYTGSNSFRWIHALDQFLDSTLCTMRIGAEVGKEGQHEHFRSVAVCKGVLFIDSHEFEVRRYISDFQILDGS